MNIRKRELVRDSSNLQKKIVEEKGFDRFVISVNKKNENAISFYKKMGGLLLSEDNNQKHFVIMCNNGGENDL